MINETVILLSHWLGNDASPDGLNQLVAAIPRINIADATPFPAPDPIAVLNDAEDKNIAANGGDPETVPALVLWGNSDPETKRISGYPIAKSAEIVAAYITAEDADPITAIRECNLAMRATRISLFVRYNSAEKSRGQRDLNGIKVLSIDSVSEHRITAADGRRKMWGLMAIRATIVETIS